MTGPQDRRPGRAEARAVLRQQMAESRARAAAVPRPSMVRYALYVGLAQIVLMVIYAALSFGFTSGLHTLILDSTAKSIKDVTYTVKGTPPTGSEVSAKATVKKASPADTVTKAAISLSAVATSGGQSFDKLATGQQVDLAFSVKNVGNAALKDVKIDHSKASGGGTWADISCAASTLDPGASTTCTESYTVTAADLHDSLSQFRTQTLLSIGLFGLMIVVLGVMIRRGSGGARWGYVALNIVGAFVGFPAALLYVTQFTTDLPKPMGIVQSLASLAGAIAIILLLLPPSRDYFNKTRVASGKPSLLGGGTAGAGGRAAAPRRGGLFGPRPAASGPSAGASDGPADDAGAGKVSISKSKAKVRSDEASAARGAELARARAKASKSKSRKTADR